MLPHPFAPALKEVLKGEGQRRDEEEERGGESGGRRGRRQQAVLVCSGLPYKVQPIKQRSFSILIQEGMTVYTCHPGTWATEAAEASVCCLLK